MSDFSSEPIFGVSGYADQVRLHLAKAAVHPQRQPQQKESTHFQNFRVWARARTPQQGLNAQNQLAHAEWLDQIVVGSKLQTFNPLAGFTSGGKDEDRK